MRHNAILLIGLTIAILVGIAGVAWYDKTLGWHRPYVNWDYDELAAYLVEHDREASECWDLIVFDPMGPQPAQQRASCIYEYAKLKKDPLVCELLMPSSYGLDCVGGAISTYHRPCALGRDRSVTWANGGKATLQQCIEGNDHECCIAAQARFIINFHSCESINTPDIHDQCLSDLAFKNADPSHCSGIESPLVKSACTVEASALRKNPSICQSCIQPIESIEDLE